MFAVPIMEISLKEALLIYSERFEDGHPLKDIALTTLHELGRTNPFKRNKIPRDADCTITNTRTGSSYPTLADACYSLGERSSEARKKIQRVLREYDLQMV